MLSQRQHVSHWRDDETCSYCGSLSPEALFRAIDAGTAKLGATDKNYKLYVDLPNPDQGKPVIKSSANYPQTGEGWVQITPENRAALPLSDWQRENWKDGHWVRPEADGPLRHAKFYFQHFTEEDQARFIELYNADKLTFSVYGKNGPMTVSRGFYRLPFFMRLAEPTPPTEPVA